jgi:hypothetical protein
VGGWAGRQEDRQTDGRKDEWIDMGKLTDAFLQLFGRIPAGGINAVNLC